MSIEASDKEELDYLWQEMLVKAHKQPDRERKEVMLAIYQNCKEVETFYTELEEYDPDLAQQFLNAYAELWNRTWGPEYAIPRVRRK